MPFSTWIIEPILSDINAQLKRKSGGCQRPHHTFRGSDNGRAFWLTISDKTVAFSCWSKPLALYYFGAFVRRHTQVMLYMDLYVCSHSYICVFYLYMLLYWYVYEMKLKNK